MSPDQVPVLYDELAQGPPQSERWRAKLLIHVDF